MSLSVFTGFVHSEDGEIIFLKSYCLQKGENKLDVTPFLMGFEGITSISHLSLVMSISFVAGVISSQEESSLPFSHFL